MGRRAGGVERAEGKGNHVEMRRAGPGSAVRTNLTLGVNPGPLQGLSKG